jgi:ABC-2 type transport system permease protein
VIKGASAAGFHPCPAQDAEIGFKLTAPGTLVWFARHESRLAWREWLAMMTAGRRRRARTVAIALVGFAIFMHLVAYATVGPFLEAGSDRRTMIAITAGAVLAWLLMVSQAMETVTRAFYSRSDLDLILASPVSARKVFAVRIATMALSVTMMALLLSAPFINVLAVRGGPHWLAGYGFVVAMGAAATALAVALTVGLFRTIGPRRTRLVAQIVAAVIGAAFVIGLQVAAILSYGTLSRVDLLGSAAVLALTPGPGSALWWPARAVLGDAVALGALMGGSLALLGLAIAAFATRFGEHAVAAAGVANGRVLQTRGAGRFRRSTPLRALRQKEWTLLRRDPWLLSQTLMQMLYLVPPALMLWRSFGEGSGALPLVVPVLAMAAGQLAGGLAWLAISGEDAPDLVATAPVPDGFVMRAKIEAVLGAIALVFAPLVALLAIASPWYALVTGLGILAAAVSATAIQFWFRTQARRSQFRRRQVSSRIATFAEAFSSIAWAGTAAVAVASLWLALIPGLFALALVAGVRLLSPHKATSGS